MASMIKIGITGVPGSGKTTLARALASTMRGIKELNNVELVSEYARRYISKHGLLEHLWEQYRVTEKQIEWEDSIKCNIMITDSPIYLGYIYASEMDRVTPKDYMCYNDIFKKLSKTCVDGPRYDIIFHLEPLLKPVDDGVRAHQHLQDNWRNNINMFIKVLFQYIFPPKQLIILDMESLETRTDHCLSCIKNINL